MVGSGSVWISVVGLISGSTSTEGREIGEEGGICSVDSEGEERGRDIVGEGGVISMEEEIDSTTGVVMSAGTASLGEATSIDSTEAVASAVGAGATSMILEIGANSAGVSETDTTSVDSETDTTSAGCVAVSMGVETSSDAAKE